LSELRNLVLSYLLRSELLDDADVVAFCDDDGRWPIGHGNVIGQVFGDDAIDWVLGGYAASLDSIDRSRFPDCREVLTARKVADRASSVGIYARVRAIREVGRFRVDLGVGTRIPVGEDTDYAWRLLGRGRGVYDSRLMSLHRYESRRPAHRVVPASRLLAQNVLRHPTLIKATVGTAFAASRMVNPGERARMLLALFMDVLAPLSIPPRTLEW
jgi:hypothetical protein